MFSSQNTSKLFLNAQNISFTLNAEQIILKDISLSIGFGEKIALVGKNGSGKSTLLKIIAGIIPIQSGKINSKGKILYLQQNVFSKQYSDTIIFDYVNDKVSNWWEVFSILEQTLNFSNFDPSQKISILSGGEFMKLNLAITLAQNPDIILFDEPTNHLDQTTKNELANILKNLKESFVIVSHDKLFLNKVTTATWHLENGILNRYGGNYDFFVQRQKELIEAQENELSAKKKEIRKLKLSLEKEKKRALRSEKEGIKKDKNDSIDKFAKGYFGNRSEKKTGKSQGKLETLIEERKLQKLNLTSNKTKPVFFPFNNLNSKKQTLSRIANGALYINEKKIKDNISLDITSKSRIWIKGNNGSGKTSLVKAIKNSLTLAKEKSIFQITNLEAFQKDIQVAYLSQNYELVNLEQSLIDNMKSYNSSLHYNKTREVLSNYLFFDSLEIQKKAKFLSGGELARLAFAMISSAPIELLILDEPTNNLDIETKNLLSLAVKDFQGALILVSHDEAFAQEIKLNEILDLNN